MSGESEWSVTVEHDVHGRHQTYVEATDEDDAVARAIDDAAVFLGVEREGWRFVSAVITDPGEE